MWTRRDFLSAGAGLLACTLPGCQPSPCCPDPDHDTETPPPSGDDGSEDTDPPGIDLPLRDRALEKGLFFGAAAAWDHLGTDPEYAQLVAQQCGIVVPEWELKLGHLRPNGRPYEFAHVDELHQFARAHDMLFRGHALVWHHPSGLPPWLLATTTRSNAEPVFAEHIRTVAGRYAGHVHSWDVVNEAIDAQSPRSDKLRQTPWLEFLGPEYIDLAFRETAIADEGAYLVYNDYGAEWATPEGEIRRRAILRLLEGMLVRGTPLHALGIQSHLRADTSPFDPRVFRSFLAEVGQLGLAIVISELDVNDQSVAGDATVRDAVVADCYRRYLDVALDESAVKGVITWGLADHYSWLRRSLRHADGSDVRPLPFDSTLQPKPAWAAIAASLEGAPPRTPWL